VKNAGTAHRVHPAAIGSVVIPAHDEATVIGRSLDALFADGAGCELEVVVVTNGCADETAAIARSCGHPVRVVELDAASKPAALRAGDEAATTFPRLYLDADVVLSGRAARRILERLRDGAIAARPPIRYETTSSSLPVRSYYRARSRVPAVLGSLWGAGLYGLSAEGRARFDLFPDVVADDLWVDRLFDRDEVEIVDCEPVVVMVPRTSRDLIRVLRRTYVGKGEPGPVPDSVDRAPETLGSTLRDLGRLAVAGPAAAFDAGTYAAFAATARLALAISPAGDASLGARRWERDNSSRGG
jgi:glycosyltransferase involved in cell wall biosynthesis